MLGPFSCSLVWYDIRNDSTVDRVLAQLPDQNKEHLVPLCGLPVSTYFSALKLLWLIDNVPSVKRAIKEERCLFGNVDSWVLWVRVIHYVASGNDYIKFQVFLCLQG